LKNGKSKNLGSGNAPPKNAQRFASKAAQFAYTRHTSLNAFLNSALYTREISGFNRLFL
jgi:hypothetical protein